MTHSSRWDGAWRGLLRAAWVLALAAAGCVASSESTVECEPGARIDCACEGGLGRQTCQPTRWWGACECAAECEPGSRRACECPGRVTTCDDYSQWRPCDCPLVCEHGCARDGRCVPNNQRASCGGAGGACFSCADTHECVSGGCLPRGEEGLTLVVVSASVPERDPSGRGCPTWDCARDPLSRPDVYVSAVGIGRTITVPDSLTPSWEEVLATGLTASRLAEPIHFTLYDDDASFLDGDDPIASVDLQLRPEQVRPGVIRLDAPVGIDTATLYLRLR
ncbi:MAG: C2 domain-containing protein [Polyangiales bacterium]